MKTVLAFAILAPLAVLSETVVPQLESCSTTNQNKVNACLRKSKTDCKTDSGCTWCDEPLISTGVTAAQQGLKCEATSSSCVCLPGGGSTSTSGSTSGSTSTSGGSTSTSGATTASGSASGTGDSGGEKGHCAAASGQLSGCTWKSIATLSTGAKVSCGQLDFGFGGCAKSTGSGTSGLPACAEDASMTKCVTSQVGSGDATTCTSGCNKCSYSSEGVSTTVCLPTKGTSCREEALGSMHLAFTSSTTCPLIMGAETDLQGGCKASLIRYLDTTKQKSCIDLSKTMGETESMNALTDATMGAMCKNKCMWRLVSDAEKISKKCGKSDLKDEDGQNSAALVAKTMSVMCYRNEAGQYCGVAMAAIGGSSRVQKRLAMASAITGAPVANPVTSAAVGKARKFLLDIADKYTSKSRSIKALQSSSGGLQLDCSKIDEIKPQFDQMKSVLGCCMGEIFRIMIDPEVMTGDDSNIMALMVGLLKECGVDLTEGSCLKPIATAATLKASLKLKIKNYTEAKKEQFKVAVQADIATNLGIPRDRVRIDVFEVKGSGSVSGSTSGSDSGTASGSASGTAASTANRAIAVMQGAEADIDVEYTIIGDQTDSAGLTPIKADLDSQSAGGFVMTNTDLEAGGNGDGSSASLTESPKSGEVIKSPEETPAPSSASAIAAPAAVAAAAVFATTVLFA